MYFSRVSRRAPGRAPETASAAHDDGGVGRDGGDVVVVAADRVEDDVVFAELAAEVHADVRVAALDLVVHGLADVVEEPAAAGDGAVEAQLVGDDLTEVGQLDRVAEDVLAVAGAVVESAHGLGDLGV